MFTKVPITAPLSGTISLHASVEDEIVSGQMLATIEAMKMEVSVTAPLGGRISALHVENFAAVVAGDTIYVVEEHA